MDESGLEWQGVVRKEHLGGTKIQDLKEATRAKKAASRPCCKTGHHLICNRRFLRRKKLQLWQLKCPKNAIGSDLVVGKKKVFTLKVATAIRGLKCEKAGAEMLKALNGGLRWLTRMCQVAWKLAKTPTDWQTVVIIVLHKKDNR